MVLGCNKVSNSSQSTNVQNSAITTFDNKTPLQKMKTLEQLRAEYFTTNNLSRINVIASQVKFLFNSYNNNVKNIDDIEVRAAAHQFLCEIGDKEALKNAKLAEDLVKDLARIDLYQNGDYHPLYIGDGWLPEGVYSEIASDEDKRAIKNALILIGRYKSPLIFKNRGYNLHPGIKSIQKDYNISNGWGGERFGKGTKEALINEVKKYVYSKLVPIDPKEY
ncbi:MAG: hypothetical protein N2Z81_00485 [Hydrogenothermaceae bacterium]|nr:hypothetical protein [Hydrogenothermaceae bacterium]